MIWWIIGAIAVYLAIGVALWLYVIFNDPWGGFSLFPLYALLLIVGWLPFMIYNLRYQVKKVNEWYKETFKNREDD
ncbi:hypothetical protein MCCARTNEY_12 [Bacillus phage vB_BanH_McCartney]|nr:hypothetical protein MCCARTNEY_12 [Bacillus phage vB_BanH_McCartney]